MKNSGLFILCCEEKGQRSLNAPLLSIIYKDEGRDGILKVKPTYPECPHVAGSSNEFCPFMLPDGSNNKPIVPEKHTVIKWF